ADRAGPGVALHPERELRMDGPAESEAADRATLAIRGRGEAVAADRDRAAAAADAAANEEAVALLRIRIRRGELRREGESECRECREHRGRPDELCVSHGIIPPVGPFGANPLCATDRLR